MTDNEIVKALECCWQEKECIGDECPLFKPINDCAPLIAMEALDLINRQKAEIERLKNRQKPTGASGYKIENGKVVFFTNMLGGCRHEYKDLDEVVKTLNELLQECYSKDEIAFALKCKTEDLKTARAEAVKEFAERLKENKIDIDVSFGYGKEHYTEAVAVVEIDNLLKEFTEGGNDG